MDGGSYQADHDNQLLRSLAGIYWIIIWIDDSVSQHRWDVSCSAASALDVDRNLDRIYLLRPDASISNVYAQLLSYPTHTGGRFGIGANCRNGGRSRVPRDALAQSRADCYRRF